jgi:deoxyribonuclease IV
MPEQRLTLGAHLSIAGGLENAVLAAQRYRCQCVQLFVCNQRQWLHPPLTARQIEVFRQVRGRTAIAPVVAHGSYLINLAAADPALYQKSIAALTDEFGRCGPLGIEFYVIHPGAPTGQGLKAGIAKVAAALDQVFDRVGDSACRLLLETTAGQGSSVGGTFEQLADIIAQVRQPRRLGVCLDTCHVFAAGYDIVSPEGYKRTIAQFDRNLGLDKLGIIHANDSKNPLGSGVDRHVHIGKGFIGRQGFANFFADSRVNRLPYILETPKGLTPEGRDLDRINLAALRRIAGKVMPTE